MKKSQNRKKQLKKIGHKHKLFKKFHKHLNPFSKGYKTGKYDAEHHTTTQRDLKEAWHHANGRKVSYPRYIGYLSWFYLQRILISLVWLFMGSLPGDFTINKVQQMNFGYLRSHVIAQKSYSPIYEYFNSNTVFVRIAIVVSAIIFSYAVYRCLKQDWFAGGYQKYVILHAKHFKQRQLSEQGEDQQSKEYIKASRYLKGDDKNEP